MSHSDSGGRISPRRWQQAYREGYMPRSRWWQYAAVWAAAGAAMHSCLDKALGELASAWSSSWAGPGGLAERSVGSMESIHTTAGWLPALEPAGAALIAIAVAGGAAMMAVLIVGCAQTGFRTFTNRFRRPGLSAPIATAADASTWWRLGLTVVHAAGLIAAIVAWSWYRGAGLLAEASRCDWSGVRGAGRLVAEAMWVIAAVTAVAGLAEYCVAWRFLARQLAMSDEEWRDEIRAVEGDPRVEARQRQLHRGLSLRRKESLNSTR